MEQSIVESAAKANLQTRWLASIEVHSDPNRDKKPTAYHEAGHAVANIIFGGWETTSVTTKTVGNSRGCCHSVVVKQLSLEQEAISYLAGPIAELLTGSVYKSGVTWDWAQAMYRIKEILQTEGKWNEDSGVRTLEQAIEPLLEHLLDETRRLVKTHEEVIRAIAEKLISVKTIDETLSGAEVNEIYSKIISS